MTCELYSENRITSPLKLFRIEAEEDVINPKFSYHGEMKMSLGLRDQQPVGNNWQMGKSFPFSYSLVMLVLLTYSK